MKFAFVRLSLRCLNHLKFDKMIKMNFGKFSWTLFLINATNIKVDSPVYGGTFLLCRIETEWVLIDSLSFESKRGAEIFFLSLCSHLPVGIETGIHI